MTVATGGRGLGAAALDGVGRRRNEDPLPPSPRPRRPAHHPLTARPGKGAYLLLGFGQLPPQLGDLPLTGGLLRAGQPGGPPVSDDDMRVKAELLGQEGLGEAVRGDASVFPAPDLLTFSGHVAACSPGAGCDEACQLLVAPAVGGPELGQGVEAGVDGAAWGVIGRGHDDATTTVAPSSVSTARKAARTLGAGDRWSAVGTSTRAWL